MEFRKYHVDAFSSRLFEGNPAAVCILEEYPSDDILISIAAEHNLAETAFVVSQEDSFFIRWFTPSVEVALCGHATLAAAFVLFNFEGYNEKILKFQSKYSGDLFVRRQGELYELDFPADFVSLVDKKESINFGLSIPVQEIYKGKSKYLVILENENQINELKPDLSEIMKLDKEGVIFSAPGESSDFVSRFFCPKIGINEDPVTGSAHTLLIPYWSKRLRKSQMIGKQLSKRGGTLYCQLEGERTYIAGNAVLYSVADVDIKHQALIQV